MGLRVAAKPPMFRGWLEILQLPRSYVNEMGEVLTGRAHFSIRGPSLRYSNFLKLPSGWQQNLVYNNMYGQPFITLNPKP